MFRDFRGPNFDLSKSLLRKERFVRAGFEFGSLFMVKRLFGSPSSREGEDRRGWVIRAGLQN